MSELTEMEKYLQKLFTEAGQDLKKKFLKYTQDFQRLDAAKQQAVEDGNITEDEYKEWRKNKLLYGMHWQRLIDRNTSELLKYNQTAIKYINGEVPQIFASGYNKVAEQIPDSPVAGFDFELINADTVNNLVHEDGIILPPKKKVDPEKDKAWNAKLINAQLLQGIMQGESIPDMAKRMMTVANSDLAGATRTARTMHTAAQNAGRQSGYNKAAQQGIIFEKTWLAANNERTRLSHSLMNGQTVAHDEKFVSPVTGVKLMFPGDWNAEGGDVGSEIYNCRCTLITKFRGFKKLNGEEAKQTQIKEQIQTQEQTAELSKAAETLINTSTGIIHEYGHDIATAEQIEFIPATTLEEAESFFSNNLYDENAFGGIGVSFKGVSLDAANEVNKTLCDLMSAYPVDKFGGIQAPTKNSHFGKIIDGSLAGFMPVRRSFLLNRTDMKTMKSVKQFFIDQQAEYKDIIKRPEDIEKLNERSKNIVLNSSRSGRMLVATNLKESIEHEYGHALQKSVMASEQWERAKSRMNLYAPLISGYATDSEGEYIAESFASYRKGEGRVDPLMTRIFDSLKRQE